MSKTAIIRQWALDNGYGPGKTGRLSREILDAYAAAEAAPAPAKPGKPGKAKRRKADPHAVAARTAQTLAGKLPTPVDNPDHEPLREVDAPAAVVKAPAPSRLHLDETDIRSAVDELRHMAGVLVAAADLLDRMVDSGMIGIIATIAMQSGLIKTRPLGR